MADTPSAVQAIRAVNKYSNYILTTQVSEDIVYVDVYMDPATKKQFVLWDEIRQVFDDALHVRHLAKALPFLKGTDYHPLKPFRIAAMPEVVLDVLVSGGIVSAAVSNAQQSQPSALKQIEQQAARYPKYDPYSTLRTQPPIRIQPSHIVSMTQAGNNFDRTPSSLPPISQPPIVVAPPSSDHKELALRRVKEVMGIMAAHVDLKGLHATGDGPPQDFHKALECYLKNLHEGQAHALYRVGDVFAKGRGVSEDSSVASSWFHKSANKGNLRAQYKVGIFYEHGRGVPQNFSQAMIWYLKAANQ
ncbi:hypothetical protein BGX24_007326, partial [Mortierella sp. AD032]